MTDKSDVRTAASSEEMFAALCVLEQRCRENAAGLPQGDEVALTWAGVLFRIDELSLLVPLDGIEEVLEPPRDITPVPATKGWVYGVANNRGTLLPIFDLQAYLFGVPTSANARNRVLVARRDEFPFGILVGEVIGIRHFEVAARTDEIPELPEALRPFAVCSFRLGGGLFPLFNLDRLTQDPGFNLAAA